MPLVPPSARPATFCRGRRGPVTLAERERDDIIERAFDPDTGIDSDAEGDIYLPPTVPSGDDTSGPTGSTLVEAPEDTTGPTGSTLVDGVLPEVDVDAVLFGSLGIDFPRDRFRFLDPCADEPDDSCPEGVGGTITLLGGGDPPDPLDISAQFYTSVTSSLELRCPNLGVDDDGVYRPLFASNNPADFTIRYWETGDPSTERTINMSTPDAEVDWWTDRRSAGDEVWANPHGGVHNCPEFADLVPGRHMAFEIHGIDPLGTEDTVRVFMETPDGVGGETNRPIKFTPQTRRDRPDYGLLSVPYDDRTEMVYMASIPKNGPRGTDLNCTDIEGDILDGRHRSDVSLVDIRHGVLVRARDSELDPSLNRVLLGSLYPEEGTTYELCAWVAEEAERSFDRPTVVERESFIVRSPRRLRIRIFIGGGHLHQALEPLDLRVEAANWDSGRGSSFPREAMGAGPLELDLPVLMTGSGSMKVPSTTLLEVTGPTGATVLTEIPTRTQCPLFFPIGCPREGTSEYDIQIPGRVRNTGLCGSSFGSCDPPSEQTYIGNLRILVERHSGPAGPPTGDPLDDGWQVRPTGSFAGAEPAEPPADPQFDSAGSSLEAIPGDPPGMRAQLEFDRPVRIVEATPFMNLIADCGAGDTQSTTDHRSTVTLTWDELCYEGAYSIGFLAVDEEGNEIDRRTHIEGAPTGDPGWGYLVLPGFDIEEFSVQVTVHQLGDGIRPQSLSLSVGGVPTGRFIAAGLPPRCTTDAVPISSYGRTVRNDGGRPISWGDPVNVYLSISGRGDPPECGADRLHVAGEMRASIELAELLAGPVTLDFGDTDIGIELHVTDVVPG
ncbi:MAG: hypothetical protein U5K29_03075 [Acidimicrobiales bacterium]|nr:hypothetical protein [Acidimicrobiales bacterium]